MDGQVKIIITDDKEKFRRLIQVELERYQVSTIAGANNGIELLKHLEILAPDVVLLDLEMPEMDGNTTFKYVSENFPEVKVMVISWYNDQELQDDYEKRGAKGYMTKDEVTDDIEHLAIILRKIKAGGKHFNKNSGSKKLNLSSTQKNIAQLTALGHTQKEISTELGMTTSNVSRQQRKIMEKMGVSTLGAFYKYITKAGLEFLHGPHKKTKGR